MNKDEFISYISKDNPGFFKTREVHIRNIAPEILEEINQYIIFYNLSPINFRDKLNYYLNEQKIQKKCSCGKNIFSDRIYCSNKCKKDNSSLTFKKIQTTLKEKYGEDSPLKIEKFKEKFKETCLNKFGVSHPSKNKNIANKIKETNIESYKNANLRNRVSKRMLKNYKEKREEIIEKRKQTNFKISGEYTTLTSNSIEKTKKTLQDRYNTSNPFAIHENTYKLAGLGSIKFFENTENKNNLIKKRIQTIISKYGSLEKMNELIFLKSKEKVISKLIGDGVNDLILSYNHDKLGFVKCKCNICKKEYDISLRLLRERTYRKDILCTLCSPPLTKWVSGAQIEIFNWLSQYIKCEQNNRKILKGGEIDIFIPEKNIAIEFNGIYWHSDLFKNKNYHLNKTLFLKEQNIQLIHIWEDLWETKKEIIKNRILSKLKINQKNIGARKCIIKQISSAESRKFYENNHLQGKTNSKINIALLYNEEIISCISISKRKIGKNKKNNYEILRFCNKIGINCIGSFSKLFNYIKNNYSGNYISYSDLCWGEGKVYEHAGFKLKEFSKPNYWYFIDNTKFHRYTYRKSELIKLGYDSGKTEFQIMNEDIKSLRVYDCGNAVWEYKST